MQSRAEYFIKLANEFPAFHLVNASATLIAFAVFMTVLILAATRKTDKEKKMAHLPFED